MAATIIFRPLPSLRRSGGGGLARRHFAAFPSSRLVGNQRKCDEGARTAPDNGNKWNLAALATAAFAGLLGASALIERKSPLSAKSRESRRSAGEKVRGLPQYSNEEVNGHDSPEKRIWVSYKNGVYDITDFIHKHPGAKNIMMAAGGSIEPFWEIYAVHKNNADVLELLEAHRIGNLKEEDAEENLRTFENASRLDDPFEDEPKRHAALKTVGQKPYNAETPGTLLADSFLTPNDLFYVRNHLSVPNVTAEDYELELSGIGVESKTFSLEDVKKFPKHEVVAVVQCGGNRRSEMNAVKHLQGLPWKMGAIGNARWGGARLYDVLKAGGLTEKEAETRVKHIVFEGYDKGADGSAYGASVPVSRGFNPYGDVLLAYEMNGKPLSRDHGFPVRVIVPGVVGARSVKWLGRIVLSDCECDSHWQQNDYKGFNPSVSWDDVDFSRSPAIQGMPVTSAITEPENGHRVKVGKDGKMKIKGYAWSGNGNRIIRVDLTADGGQTWFEGKIDGQDGAEEPRHYGWTLWSAEVAVPKGARQVEVWSKAVDSSYNVQPESFRNIWNLRGLLSNAYSKLKVEVEH